MLLNEDSILSYQLVDHIRALVPEGDVISFPPGLWKLSDLQSSLSQRPLLHTPGALGAGELLDVVGDPISLVPEGEDAPEVVIGNKDVYLRMLHKNPSKLKVVPISRALGGRLHHRAMAVLRLNALPDPTFVLTTEMCVQS